MISEIIRGAHFAISFSIGANRHAFASFVGGEIASTMAVQAK